MFENSAGERSPLLKSVTMDPIPTRPWWRKKRWWAAVPVWGAACYVAAFIPACWGLVRSGPVPGDPVWEFADRAYRPAAFVLMVCPPSVQIAVASAVEFGLPAGMRFRIHDTAIVAVYESHRVYGRAVVQMW